MRDGAIRSCVGFFLGVFCISSSAFAQSVIAGTEAPQSIFPLSKGVAAYQESNSALVVYEREGSALKEKRRVAVSGGVWGVAESSTDLFVVSGMSRKALDAPLKLLRISANGKEELLFTNSGERNQASYLAVKDGRLWLTYFESKYMTRTGYCPQIAAKECAFVEVSRARLGDVVDVSGDTVVIGRPYGDAQGQDGDLTLVEKGTQIQLPSYRGVRSAALFGKGASPQIAVGDGWHQNYGQIAQGRLSVLKKSQGESRYALSLIDRDPSQYSFSRILPFTKGTKQYLAAVGNSKLVVYGPEPEWKRAEAYAGSLDDVVFDAVLLDATSDGIWFAVLDQGIRLVRFPIE